MRTRAVPGRDPIVLIGTLLAIVLLAANCSGSGAGRAVATTAPATVEATTAPASTAAVPATSISAAVAATGANVYAEAAAGDLSPAVIGDRPLVYVPNSGDGTVSVIDPTTMSVVDHFRVGARPQHVVPSWDLKTLYVNANLGNQLVPIDPVDGTPGKPIPITDPYNLYFTPDGSRAIVMAEKLNALMYYDPHTWKLEKTVPAGCRGPNHADWSPDFAYFLVTCEFSGQLLKVDTATGQVLGRLTLSKDSMPQDVRLIPNGQKFYVADMMADGLWIVDGNSFAVTGFLATGRGAHGLYPSRDGRLMYVANRGRHMNDEGGRSRPGQGSISVVDPAADTVVTRWAIPGGGSPDMGGVTADGKQLWLSGRYDNVVYVFDTATGVMRAEIPVGSQPHGLCVFPQPGRFSLGHTGNNR